MFLGALWLLLVGITVVFGIRFSLWLLWLLLQMLLSLFVAPDPLPMLAPIAIDHEPMIEVHLEEPELGVDDLPELDDEPELATDDDAIVEVFQDEGVEDEPVDEVEPPRMMVLSFIGTSDESSSMLGAFSSDDSDELWGGLVGSGVNGGIGLSGSELTGGLGIHTAADDEDRGIGALAFRPESERAEAVGSSERNVVLGTGSYGGGVEGGVEGGVPGGVPGGIIGGVLGVRGPPTAPISLRRVEPRYPRALRGEGAVEARCDVRIRVDADGRAAEVLYARCLEPFHDAARAAAERSRWHAAGEVVDGRIAGAGWVVVTYEFAP